MKVLILSKDSLVLQHHLGIPNVSVVKNAQSCQITQVHYNFQDIYYSIEASVSLDTSRTEWQTPEMFSSGLES